MYGWICLCLCDQKDVLKIDSGSLWIFSSMVFGTPLVLICECYFQEKNLFFGCFFLPFSLVNAPLLLCVCENDGEGKGVFVMWICVNSLQWCFVIFVYSLVYEWMCMWIERVERIPKLFCLPVDWMCLYPLWMIVNVWVLSLRSNKWWELNPNFFLPMVTLDPLGYYLDWSFLSVPNFQKRFGIYLESALFGFSFCGVHGACKWCLLRKCFQLRMNSKPHFCFVPWNYLFTSSFVEQLFKCMWGQIMR